TDVDHMCIVPRGLSNFPHLNWNIQRNDHLVIKRPVDLECCQFLVSLFSNLKSLFVCELSFATCCEQDSPIEYLLENLPELTSVGLYGVTICWYYILPILSR